MAHSQRVSNRPVLVRVGSLVVGSTLALTLAFFGVLTFATGGTTGLGGRVPYYVLVAAVTFAGALFGLDRRDREGRSLLVVSALGAIAAFVLSTLGIEGVAYAIRRPDAALASRQLLYLVAAAMVSTGLGYWVRCHWRELTPTVRR